MAFEFQHRKLEQRIKIQEERKQLIRKKYFEHIERMSQLKYYITYKTDLSIIEKALIDFVLHLYELENSKNELFNYKRFFYKDLKDLDLYYGYGNYYKALVYKNDFSFYIKADIEYKKEVITIKSNDIKDIEFCINFFNKVNKNEIYLGVTKQKITVNLGELMPNITEEQKEKIFDMFNSNEKEETLDLLTLVETNINL